MSEIVSEALIKELIDEQIKIAISKIDLASIIRQELSRFITSDDGRLYLKDSLQMDINSITCNITNTLDLAVNNLDSKIYSLCTNGSFDGYITTQSNLAINNAINNNKIGLKLNY